MITCWHCEKSLIKHPYRNQTYMRLIPNIYFGGDAIARVCAECANRWDPPTDEEITSKLHLRWNLYHPLA